MGGKLVSALDWNRDGGGWRLNLVLQDGGYERKPLTPGSDISFIVQRGRFCRGYTRLATRDKGGSTDSWRERTPCPDNAEIKSGSQCSLCRSIDVMNPCLRCVGDECQALLEVRRACEGNECYVYLASFNGRIKAGVSSGARVIKRWIEQGADAAVRVLRGNGMEVRRFEKRIQEKMGALNHLRTDQKLDLPTNGVADDLTKLRKFAVQVHAAFPEERHIKEEPQALIPLYGIADLDVKPLRLRIEEGATISGQIIGAKGSVLIVNMGSLPRVINMRNLIGRKIDFDKPPDARTQSGLGRFIQGA